MARTSSKTANTTNKPTNKTTKIIKSIPSSEDKKMFCFTRPSSSGDKYIITQNPLKQQFTLWKCVEEGFEKISASNNPSDFDDIIPYEM